MSSRTSYPELLLDNQLCFLAYRAHLAFTARYRPLLDELGLTYPQYLALLVLWEEDGIRVGTLASKLGLDTGTTSPLLKRLESKGLVERRREKNDERTVLVHLKPAGLELRERARTVPHQLAACASGFSEEEAQTAYSNSRTVLKALVANLESCKG